MYKYCKKGKFVQYSKYVRKAIVISMIIIIFAIETIT